MQLRYKITLILIFGLTCYAFGRYVQPAKQVIKTETLVKTVTVDHVDTVTVTKETVKPDGTKEVETTKTDKSVVTNNSDVNNKSSNTITNNKPQWRVRADLIPQVAGGNTFGPLYGAGVERRILGPIWAGAFVNASRSAGLSVGLEF
jgi:hypothetical protein